MDKSECIYPQTLQCPARRSFPTVLNIYRTNIDVVQGKRACNMIMNLEIQR